MWMKSLQELNNIYKKNQEILEKYYPKLYDIFWIYRDLDKLIPQKRLFSKSLLPIMESYIELENAYHLLLLGMYKQSFATLRNVVELGLLSIYFVSKPEELQIWYEGKIDTPSIKEISSVINHHENVQYFLKKHPSYIKGLQKQINDLHNYVHTRGGRRSNLFLEQATTFNSKYREKLFNYWYKYVLLICRLIVLYHILIFPIGITEFNWFKKVGIDNPFPVLDMGIVRRIKQLFPVKVIKTLLDIFQNDTDAQNLYRDITALPDLTREQIDQQILEFDKLLIKGQGFKNWVKNEKQLLKHLSPDEQKIIRKRIKVLKSWAKEHGYY